MASFARWAKSLAAFLNETTVTPRKTAGRCRVGTSGYVYTHWKDIFYPSSVQSLMVLIRWLTKITVHLPRKPSYETAADIVEDH